MAQDLIDLAENKIGQSDRQKDPFCAEIMLLRQFTKQSHRTGISRPCLRKCKFFLQHYEFLERVILLYLSIDLCFYPFGQIEGT